MNPELFLSDFENTVPEDGRPVLVDYRENPVLRRQAAAFHWWKNKPTSMHYHNFYEIFLITDGSALHRFNGEETVLPAGTLRLIRPPDVHQLCASPGSGCTHMNLLAREEKLLSLADALCFPLPASQENAPLETRLTPSEMRFFLDRAELINLSGYGSGGATRLILEMLSEALSLIGRNLPAAAQDRPEWFSLLTQKLHSPKYLTCRASDVYALAPCSAPVLIRCFGQYEGCTVVQYLTRLRMDYAASLLRTTNFPVNVIAARLGYDSVSHFCRVFRQHTKLTPQAYRAGA